MILALLASSVLGQSPTLQSVGPVKHPPIDEMSGIVRSKRWPEVYWVHNDSGDEARIFAIRKDGSVIQPGAQNRREDAGQTEAVPATFPGLAINGASNNDWEDIAYDGQKLYIGDVGNNNNARRDLGIYVVNEPNPYDARRATPITRWPVAYEDQQDFPAKKFDFDCEAIFVLRGKLWFITKHRMGTSGVPDVSANLYSLDLKSARADRVNVLRKRDGIRNLGGWVTAADASPDGKRLAVLVQAPLPAVHIFTLDGSDRMLSGKSKKFALPIAQAKQCEAICWDDDQTVRITNEQRDLYTLLVGK